MEGKLADWHANAVVRDFLLCRELLHLHFFPLLGGSFNWKSCETTGSLRSGRSSNTQSLNCLGKTKRKEGREEKEGGTEGREGEEEGGGKSLWKTFSPSNPIGELFLEVENPPSRKDLQLSACLQTQQIRTCMRDQDIKWPRHVKKSTTALNAVVVNGKDSKVDFRFDFMTPLLKCKPPHRIFQKDAGYLSPAAQIINAHNKRRAISYTLHRDAPSPATWILTRVKPAVKYLNKKNKKRFLQAKIKRLTHSASWLWKVEFKPGGTLAEFVFAIWGTGESIDGGDKSSSHTWPPRSQNPTRVYFTHPYINLVISCL